MKDSDRIKVKEMLLERIEEVITTLFPKARKDLRDYRIGDLSGEAGTSLAINYTNAKGLWVENDKSGDGRKTGNVIQLIAAAKGTDDVGAVGWACEFLGIPNPYAFRTPKTKDGKDFQFANPRALAENRRKLVANKVAMEYLTGSTRGLRPETIEHFQLGLYTYTDKATQSVIYANALSYPQLDAQGNARARFLRSLIPGVTTGRNSGEKDWASGEPSTYWVTPTLGRRTLVVVEGAKDGWRLWQEIQGTPLASTLCIITSTHGSVIPREWQDDAQTFWGAWERIYAGQDADGTGDKLAAKIKGISLRDVHRLRVPEALGKDWTDFFQAGGTLEEFTRLLESSRSISPEMNTVPEPTAPDKPGLYAVDPIDVNTAFVRGHLYYPFRAFEVVADGDLIGRRWRNWVLRSDGTLCKSDYLPAPRGTPREDLVLALDDGTILSKSPVADPVRGTFKTDSIQQFRQAREQGRSAMTMTPALMLEKIHQHLQSTVILPYSEDYALLAFVVVTSYVQAIFDAVPLVLVVGVAGSGKSEIGKSIAEVSCNATVINGQTSAASVARVLDSLGGLAVFDDLEGIAGSSKNKGDFSELVQQLKVSYKKATAKKSVTNTNTMRVEELSFFGIKVINNTEGADEILSSRMLKIHTRRVPKDLIEDHKRPAALNAQELAELRANLHFWAMESARDLHTLYRSEYAEHTQRQEEITAPLRVIARFIGHADLERTLGAALTQQEKSSDHIDSATDLLVTAVRELVRQGYWHMVSTRQLMLEMQRLAGDTWGKSSTTEIAEWQEPRWVGRQLRTAMIVDPRAKDERPRLWGVQMRVHKLEEQFVAETISALQAEGFEVLIEPKVPLDFCECVPCPNCPYLTHCDLVERKAQHLRSKGSRDRQEPMTH